MARLALGPGVAMLCSIGSVADDWPGRADGDGGKTTGSDGRAGGGVGRAGGGVGRGGGGDGRAGDVTSSLILLPRETDASDCRRPITNAGSFVQKISSACFPDNSRLGKYRCTW